MNNLLQNVSSFSYREVLEMSQEIAWKQMSSITLLHALNKWTPSLSKHTAVSYSNGMKILESRGIIDLNMTLQSFSMVKHPIVLRKIAQMPYSPATLQARASCYISFTRFLHKMTDGLINIAVADRTGVDRTFFKLRDKIKTEALEENQYQALFKQLSEDGNNRERLIASLLLQGGKRISEVLNLNVEDIIWEKKMIRFKHSKTRKMEKVTYITIPDHLLGDLRNLVGKRVKGPAFISKYGTRISYGMVTHILKRAAKRIGLEKICTHMFRATCVTMLKAHKYPDYEIQKITGHSTAERLHEYDKHSLEDNISREIDLVLGKYGTCHV